MNVNFSKCYSGIDLLKRIMKITLYHKITILKILTAVTFLFVIIPGDIWIPMWMGLLMGMSYMRNLQGVISLLIAAAVIYIFISSKGFSRINQWLTITAIGILYIPIVLTLYFDLKDFRSNGFFPPLTYIIFITISIATIGLLNRKDKNE
jgi:hypothetical protein